MGGLLRWTSTRGDARKPETTYVFYNEPEAATPLVKVTLRHPSGLGHAEMVVEVNRKLMRMKSITPEKVQFEAALSGLESQPEWVQDNAAKRK